MPDKHRIKLITTGGTIAGQVRTDRQDKDIIRTADEFSTIVKPSISYLERKNNLEIDIEPFELDDIDSSDITKKHWVKLATNIKNEFNDYNSFIITHGTNTLGYTSAALSFSIANSGKPIILTGSQVPAGLPGTDALTNLNNAIRIAVWRRESAPQIKGVMAVFGSHIITGTRVKKKTEFDYDAFDTFIVGNIGRIGRIININEANLIKHLEYLSTNEYPEAREKKDLQCDIDFDMRIVSLTEFPGMKHEIFETLVVEHDIRGFIFRAFGAGDASSNLIPAFEYLKREEIPIVVTTQAPNGNANFQVNEPGQYLKSKELAIPAHDMSIESQTVKLAWLLAKKNKGEATYQQVCKNMTKDIRGEINVNFEIGM